MTPATKIYLTVLFFGVLTITSVIISNNHDNELTTTSSGFQLLSNDSREKPSFNLTTIKDGYDYEVKGVRTNYTFSIKNDSNFGDGTRFCVKNHCLTYQTSDMSYRNEFGSQDYISSVQATKASLQNKTLTYYGLYPNTDLVYSISDSDNEGIKEDYVLNSLPRNPASWLTGNVTLNYGGYIKYGNLTMRVNGVNMGLRNFVTKNDIDFYTVDNEKVFSLPAPYAYDSNSEVIDVEYEVFNQGGQIWFYVKVPYDWLNDSTRAYPVYIDPTIVPPNNFGLTQGTGTLSDSISVVSGDTVFVLTVCECSGSTHNVTDVTDGELFTLEANYSWDGGFSNIAIWKLEVVTGGTKTISYFNSFTGRRAMQINSLNATNGFTLDQTDFATGTGTTGLKTTPTITTTADDEYLLGAASNSFNKNPFTPTSPWTELSDTGTTRMNFEVSYDVGTTAGDYNYSGTFTSDAGTRWVLAIASFIPGSTPTSDTVIDCSTNPTISTNTDYNGTTVFFNGTGTATVTANLTNASSYVRQNGCRVLRTSGGNLKTV